MAEVELLIYWFSSLDDLKTHDIFVLHENLLAIIWSPRGHNKLFIYTSHFLSILSIFLVTVVFLSIFRVFNAIVHHMRTGYNERRKEKLKQSGKIELDCWLMGGATSSHITCRNTILFWLPSTCSYATYWLVSLICNQSSFAKLDDLLLLCHSRSEVLFLLFNTSMTLFWRCCAKHVYWSYERIDRLYRCTFHGFFYLYYRFSMD